jgi:hypothetical protein
MWGNSEITAAVALVLTAVPYNAYVTISTRSLSVGFAAFACALAIIACGSTGSESPGGARADQALAWVNCLRSHGVPNFPDPDPDGRIPNIPSGIDTAARAFLIAQKACAPLLPGATGAGPSPASRRLQLLAVARCIRDHGVQNFPDPTTSPPPSPPPGSRTGNALGGPGGYLVFPPASPALTRAMAACGFRLP